jgi:hypothetical protein
MVAGAVNAYVPGTGYSVSTLGQAFYNHYNQSQEFAADAVGLQYAAAAGYDPRVGVTFWERFAVEVPQSLSAGFFDSHPSSPERVVALQQHSERLIAQGCGVKSATSVAAATVTTPPVVTVAPAAIAPVTQPVGGMPVSQPVAFTPVVTPPPMPIPATPVQTVIPASYTAPSSAPFRYAPPQWTSQNPVSTADTQLRNAEREFRAGRMSLEEFREIKRVLQGE